MTVLFDTGSEKRQKFGRTRRSCPAPQVITQPDLELHSSVIPDRHLPLITGGGGVECVVCMERDAAVALSCGHRCLCLRCADRVIEEFGCCPLCRHLIILSEDVIQKLVEPQETETKFHPQL